MLEARFAHVIACHAVQAPQGTRMENSVVVAVQRPSVQVKSLALHTAYAMPGSVPHVSAEPLTVTIRTCPIGKVITYQAVRFPVTVTPVPIQGIASMAVSTVAVVALKASGVVVPRIVPLESATVMVNVHQVGTQGA